MIEKIKKFRFILLIVAAILPYILGTVGVFVSIISLIIYCISEKKHSLASILFLITSVIGVLLLLLGFQCLENMENTGIDGIGEALGYAAMVHLGEILILVSPIIILIIDNRKIIFSKKGLVIISSIAVVALLGYKGYIFSTTEKVDKNIPNVADFEKELNERGFETQNSDYRLYGISNKNDKAIKLDFKNNNTEKYPLYVYSEVDYPWLVYYANGEICAVRGKYWDSFIGYDNKTSNYMEEKIIWGDPREILSEKEDIIVYDLKLNRYSKGNTVTYTDFNYYSTDHSKENSVFIDIPELVSWGDTVEQIERIDKETLDSRK